MPFMVLNGEDKLVCNLFFIKLTNTCLQ